jgi:hypothetical protein
MSCPISIIILKLGARITIGREQPANVNGPKFLGPKEPAEFSRFY